MQHDALLPSDPPYRHAAAVPPGAPAALFAAVAGRYGDSSRFARGYVGAKLRRDPATMAILRLAAQCGGFGRVADLGCGRGQLALALLVAGLAEQVTGLDLDAAKLADARHAAGELPASFMVANLAATDLPACDTALLVDVLYRLPEAAQLALLAGVANAARRRVVIRAFDPELGWRSRVGRAMEVASRALRGDRRSVIAPLPLGRLAAPLEAAGFTVSVIPCWGATPLPNVLLLGERRAA